MNIVSVDLPWKKETKGRRAVAIASLDGNVKIGLASDDNELLELVGENTETGSIILLDIPIDGCDKLDGGHFRAIDKAIAHQTLPVLPASNAGSRGKCLKTRLEKSGRDLKIYEIYPYAVYKFLAYLKDRKLLEHLNVNKFDTMLDDKFRNSSSWPPKYKREKNKGKRVSNMEYLYSLLTDRNLDLSFQTPLRRPGAQSNLDQLSDEYDACLGAIAGIYFANDSRYACIAGDSEYGEILLLADRWLQTQLKQEIGVRQR